MPRSRISKQGVVELNNLTGRAVPAAFLKSVAAKVLLQEKKKGAGLSIVIAGEKLVLKLNRRYLNKSKVANVLSFPFNSAQGKLIPELGLGEVMLCPAEIRKNAKEYGISYKRAIAWMLIHGTLHLIGYTHSQMKKKEKLYLSFVS